MTDDNEYELLYMYRKGQQQAFGMLLEMVHPFVIKTYASMKAHWQAFEPDEAMQAARLGLLNAVHYYRADRQMSLRSFMLMCIERQMHSTLRHIRRISRQDYLSPLSLDRMIRDTDGLYLSDTLSADASRDPGQLSRHSALLRQIYLLLEDCPKDRRVLILRTQGYSYQETADLLGISRKDVDNSVQRIRRRIAYLFD
ncbi:MAG: sigma-70 family RNA polymerase sigma factor [Erysipelotrichaceae bacterium]|nr:sigma-70 family RNA polymerase sigma factor [Erysipelotrichaceae bacterium]